MEQDGGDVDTVSLLNLQIPKGIMARDIWGLMTLQPVLVSVEIELRNGFKSAANLDALDTSTIHYGNLAKAIQEAWVMPVTENEAVHKILVAVEHVAGVRKTAECVVRTARITLRLPKAMVSGDGLSIVEKHVYSEDQMPGLVKRSTIFSKIRCMALIGVNARERTGTQALVVTCELKHLVEVYESMHVSRFLSSDVSPVEFERFLIETIEQTHFETLEALANHLCAKMNSWVRQRNLPIGGARISLEKPNAVLLADAPVITVQRSLGFNV